MTFPYEKYIYPDNSQEVFMRTAEKIDKAMPNAQKDKLHIDVDGTTILSWYVNGNELRLLDDYDVGRVYILSQIPIPKEI